MPEPLSEAAAAQVEKLLREGKSAVDISRQLIKRWPLVTPLRVRMEAYRLGIGLPRTGRPNGSKDSKPRAAYEKRSPYRKRALELRAEGLSFRAAAEQLSEEAGRPFSPEGVRKLTLSDGTNKNN